MASLKYFLYLFLIVAATTRANPAPAATDDYRVDISTHELNIRLGGSGSVTCTPGGFPVPRVQWRKHGGDFGKGVQQNGNNLIISNAQSSDRGYYMCTGIVDRKNVKQAYVLVNIKEEEERPQRVSVRQKSLKIRRGENGTLECIPKGNPLPSVQWRKGAGGLSRQASQEGNRLVITNAQLEDAGQYICHAMVESTSVWSDFASIEIENVGPVTRPPPPPQQQVRAREPGNPRVRVSVKQVRVVRGGSGRVDCFPEGTPQARIHWSKEDGKFNNRVRQSGNSLVISNAQESDGGNYVCNGLVESTAVWSDYVQVLIESGSYAPYRPDQLPKPLDVTIAEGQDQRISCDFKTGDENQVVSWSRRDRRPFPQNVRHNGRELIFQKATQESVGEYLCKVTGGGYLLRQLYVRITIEQPRVSEPPPVNPKVKVSTRQVQIRRGESGTVDCIPEGSPVPIVVWNKEEGELSNGVQQVENKLTISNAQDSDAGNYVCNAIVEGTVVWSDYLQVAVVENPTTQSPPQRPRVKVTVRKVQIPRGESKTVDCIPEGSPIPRVHWSKGGGKFSDGVRQAGNMITISNAQDSDAGDYVCNAIVEGTVVWSDYLKVAIVENATPQPPGNPKVKVSVQQVQIPRGESRTVDCIPEGSPLPRVYWSKENGKFSNEVRQAGNMLTISNAQDSDGGNYVCNAVVEGTVVWSDYLQIAVVENEALRPKGEPRVKVSERQVQIPRGEGKTIDCIPEGSPLPIVTWSKEEGEFSADVRQAGNMLSVSNAQDSDGGNYVCNAVVEGTVVWSDYLQVAIVENVQPSPPRYTSRVVVGEPQVTLPTGGSKTIECIPEGSPLPTVQWNKVDGVFGAGVRAEGNNLIISYAEEGDSGNYACNAVIQSTVVNTAYLQVRVEEVESNVEETIQVPDQTVAARVKVSESELKIAKGESRTIDCNPEGSPLPRVHWSKNGGDFSSRVRQEGNALVISMAEEEDTGDYMCNALMESTVVFTDYLKVEVYSNDLDKTMCRVRAESTLWCLGNAANWYYDPEEHKCTKFAWNGCGTNANKFETEEQCSLACDGV